ncbi:hypothetical protein GOODEAATRI_019546, partial [Goodea atripinnis]
MNHELHRLACGGQCYILQCVACCKEELYAGGSDWLTLLSLEWIMAASKPVEPQSGSGLPRWQLALLVGTPIVLGVGAVYLWNRSRTKQKKGTGERKTPEGSASPVQGQDGAPRTNREDENMSPLDRAQAAKNKGNKYFKAGKYDKAIQCYTEAIDL